MERCPICGNQAISCFEHCFNEDGSVRKEFEEGKRSVYVVLPNFCRRCLKHQPSMFMVPNEEWKKLPKELHTELLCKECYDKIMRWMNKNG